MSRIKSVVDADSSGNVSAVFYCPGCEESHAVYVTHQASSKVWGYNGDQNLPTLSPSIKVTGTVPLTEAEYDRVMAGEKVEPKDRVCHSFVVEGRIQFLNDCTHRLAGQTVDLPDIDTWWDQHYGVQT